MSQLYETFKDQYVGAKWQRVDFHLHSPGSFSFALPNGLNLEKDHDQLVEKYVQALVDQGIQIAAITDYQGIRINWFVDIQRIAYLKGIIIFPGAELSFKAGKHGLHVLAIFPVDTNLEGINTSIQALDMNPGNLLVDRDRNHHDIDPVVNIKECLRRFRDSTHAIIIPAHPNNDDGLFKSLSAKDAAEIIQIVEPDAIENFSETDKQRISSTEVVSRTTLDRIASVEFSDPKSFDEIGSKRRSDGRLRATYAKLSINNEIQAFRLAFHDPQILIAVGKRPEIVYTHFLGFEVDGSGFLGGIKVTFSPELNVLVGGRGVGKSAILETIQYVLNMTPLSPREYRQNLVQYALGSGGKVILYVEQVINPNVRRLFRFERVWGENTRVFELDPEREVPLAPNEVLGDQEGPLYFGQREIYDITRQDVQRLKLLDEIIGRQAQAQVLQVQKIEVQLRDNARSILEKRRKLLEREDIEQRLKEIRHNIELYRRHGLVDKLREATALSSDEQRLNQAIETTRGALEEWQTTAETWSSRWKFLTQQLQDGESSKKEYLAEYSDIIENLQTQFFNLFKLGEQSIITTGQQAKEIFQRWQAARRPLDDEIQVLKQELGTQSLDPDELIRLTTEQTRLEPLMRALDATERELEQVTEDRGILLNRLREAHRQEWSIREQQASAITQRLGKRVEVKVIYKGQQNEFVNLLADFFRGSGIDRRSLEKVVLTDPAVDGIYITEKVCHGQNVVESEFGLSPTRSQQLCDFLKEEEARLFELQLLSPDDAVQVFLKLEDRYVPLHNLSDGQRATAMLLLLLVQEERLLIVDQPEDDLDNRFIYEDIVRILREQKGRRQLLAATHNPNIPVLGYAELIIALEASSDHASIVAEGAIDQLPVQEFVRNVMEGGEEAFRRRAQTYGWI